MSNRMPQNVNGNGQTDRDDYNNEQPKDILKTYEPNEGKATKKKDTFWEQLIETLEECNGMLLIMENILRKYWTQINNWLKRS